MRYYLSYLTVIIPLALMSCQNSQNNDQSSDTNSRETIAQLTYQNIRVVDFREKMQEDNIVILDVRTPSETASGKIEGAIEIDYNGDDFEQKIDELDKDKTYLVYCRSGGRSSRACQIMADKDFKSLYNLMGGFIAWQAVKQ